VARADAQADRFPVDGKAGIGAWLGFYNRASEHPSVYAIEEKRLC
jgi:phage/plasmid primase-like uncharacterized protein